MSDTQYDVAIIGGGLAGGLTALALHRHAPEISFIIVEAGETLGGNHRWSWFASDVPEESRKLLAGFEKAMWDEGYDIAFPAYSRTLETPYRSLSSKDFHASLMEELPEDSVLFGTMVSSVNKGQVVFSDGDRISAKRVIDARTFRPSTRLGGGWQIFLGQHIRTEKPHGLTRPVIMDATVDQVAPYGNEAAYRFVYVLPLSEDEVFVEDTYYADRPRIDKDVLRGRTQTYAASKGWKGEVIGEETGILPVISGGNFAGFQGDQANPGVAMIGARAGFSHPLTSYTIPFAAANALAVADFLANKPASSADELAAFCAARAREHWNKTGFYRTLSRMLFEAAEPDKRVVVFEHFYRLKEELVERFYAGKSSLPDKLRVFIGKPPVSIARAMRAFSSKGKPFKTEKTS